MTQETVSTRTDLRWILGVLALGVCFVAYLEWLDPFFFLYDDNASYHLPSYVHSWRALVDGGEIAFLNLHQSCGAAHLGVGQTSVLYPTPYVCLTIAAALGDLRWAFELEVLLHLLLTALGTFLLLRRLGRSADAAAVGALFLLTVPFLVVVSRGWVVMTRAATFGVWGLLLLLRLLERPTWGRALAYAGSKTLFFLAGYPQMLAVATLCEALFLVCHWILEPASRAGARRVVGRLVGAAAITTAWSAPLLLSMLYHLRDAVRDFSALPAEQFDANALDPLGFLAAQVFRFRPGELFHTDSAIYYLGLPVLVGAVWGAWRGDRRHRSLALVAALTFVSSTAAWSALYALPLVNSFRWPIKHVVLFLVYLTPLAALAFDLLLARSRKWAALATLVVLGSQVALVSIPERRATTTPITLNQSVEAVRTDQLLAEIDPNGRVATFRRLGRTVWAPQLLTHNFATLYDQRQFGGYEPLMSRTASDIALGTEFATFNFTPEKLTPQLFAYLGTWGVTDVLAPADPETRSALVATGALRLAASNGGIDLYRNPSARPIVESLRRREPVDATWGVNSVSFEVGEETGDGAQGDAIRVALAPLDGWTVRLDGEDLGRPDEHPLGGFVVGVPPGRHRVELRFVAPGFRLGVQIAAVSTCVLLAWLLVIRRRSGS